MKFVIAYKDTEKCKFCGRGNPNFLDIFDKYIDIDGDRYRILNENLNTINAEDYSEDWVYAEKLTDEQNNKLEKFKKYFKEKIDKAKEEGYKIVEIEVSDWAEDFWDEVNKIGNYSILAKEPY